ncbi:DUF302 domain-containing protein [Methylorubrum extorquens]|uniref:DUF302 domain-containing protein n=1 Tax=Methylorubrum extorquens TaxID=408 RepID=UPI0022377B3F|nr:DUF302 domain-containing protein [Methylorubrum extorquens]UYW28269.1 DUF302 domain-containing protein [Methylorubrum extorquens]
MRRRSLAVAVLLAAALPAEAAEILTRPSGRSVTETLDRLQAQATEGGFAVVARVPHAKAAKGVGMDLRPTEALIFGNPKGGTPLMACDQRIGLDLPLRALAWEDANGKVWLAMPDPETFRSRYDLGTACDGPIQAMRTGIVRLMDKATEP